MWGTTASPAAPSSVAMATATLEAAAASSAPSPSPSPETAIATMRSAARVAAQRARTRIEWMFDNLAAVDYIGEPVSVLQHSWQAYCKARDNEETEDTQVAALLHDIGHMLGMEAGFKPGMDGCGTPYHEGVAADFLRDLGCSEECCFVVRSHVDAKRYLVHKHGDAYALSEASRVTLGFQGGPMVAAEAAAFEAHPLFRVALRMRTYDEMAKAEGVGDVPSSAIGELVEAHVYRNLMARGPCAPAMAAAPARQYQLSAEQLRFYDENGFLIVRGHPRLQAVGLRAAARDLAALPAAPSYPWLVHHEEVSLDFGLDGGGRKTVVCPTRVENFVKYHSEVAGTAADIAGQLFRDEAVLFKDKINFKFPGGGGFKLHQDATAYATAKLARSHISAMVVVDDCDSEDLGPLQIADRDKSHLDLSVLPNVQGVVTDEASAGMHFLTLLLAEGDLVFFSSYVPHQSGTNVSLTRSRAAAFLTFNAGSEGDHHASYYAVKREAVEKGSAGSAISINDDFRGKLVSSPPAWRSPL